MGSFSTIRGIRGSLIFEYTINELAMKFNEAETDIAASYIDHISLIASIFDNPNLPTAKAASIFDNPNLSEAKLQAILDNPNLSIQKGQEIVDAMSNPAKIGTGGRRGYIGDDWDDNKLSSRDKAATVATALSRIVQKFRPEWSIGNKGTSPDPYADNKQLIMPADPSNTGGKEVYTSLNTNTGTFKIKFRNATTTTATEWVFPIAIFSGGSYLSGGDYYAIFYRTDGSAYRLEKRVGGTRSILIDSTWDGDDAWHEAKFTRDESGNLELFYDGVSKGTATNTAITSFDTLEVYYSNGVQVDGYFDDLEVF